MCFPAFAYIVITRVSSGKNLKLLGLDADVNTLQSGGVAYHDWGCKMIAYIVIMRVSSGKNLKLFGVDAEVKHCDPVVCHVAIGGAKRSKSKPFVS